MTHACASDGRTAASRRPPRAVPSRWLSSIEATRAAVRSEWGLLAV
ncbi:MAG: hypothetical protein ACRDSO_16430 [Pseudonocardiaceae bacterium]